MDPFTLIMGGLGAAGQIGGGILGGIMGDQAAEQQRKQLDEAVKSATRTYEGMTVAERERALLEQARARRTEAQTYRGAQQAGLLAQMAVMGSQPYQQAAGFIQDQFSQGLPEFLAREYAGRLRTAQAARGIEFGGAPAQDEAALLTKMAYEHKIGLLDQMRQLAMDPFNINTQGMQAELATRGGAQGIGLAAMQANMGSLATAAQIAQAQAGPLAQLQMARANAPVSSGGMAALSTGLSGLGGALSGFASMYQQNADAEAQRSLMSQLLQQRMGGGYMPSGTGYFGNGAF